MSLAGADPAIPSLCERLVRDHAVHTILLYGSRANGRHTADSDHDIAAFGAVADTHPVTDLVGDVYLDVFVYPERWLREPPSALLRLRGSVVLLQHADSTVPLLAALDQRFAAGPPALHPSVVQARRDWLHKMAQRMRRADTEGHFRRAWLLTALLEDCFVLRQSWYEGSKKALAWLADNDAPGLRLLQAALVPNAPPEAIDRLVRHVAGTG